ILSSFSSLPLLKCLHTSFSSVYCLILLRSWSETSCGVYSMSDLEGVMLSDYLLLKCISKGGVADVYRARQTTGEGNFEVAVKIFRPGYAQRESFRDYFMTE